MAQPLQAPKVSSVLAIFALTHVNLAKEWGMHSGLQCSPHSLLSPMM
jgi:hypothetical protein